ncbi:MAG: transcription elongation factor GreB [Flavobacteriales bacterium]|jgi:transcription elongation factor GreB
MGRWRPPREKSSPYISQTGIEALRKELRQLWKIERPQVTEIVHQAALNGDRSENGDYIYGKKRLREIDYRVRYLTNRIEDAIIVEYSPTQEGKVFFGAYVELENDSELTVEYRLVGSDELDPSKGYISIDSPMAKALIGKSLDDEISVQTPEGLAIWYINKIRYKHS